MLMISKNRCIDMIKGIESDKNPDNQKYSGEIKTLR
jgi:hypothetical protein